MDLAFNIAMLTGPQVLAYVQLGVTQLFLLTKAITELICRCSL